MHRIFRYALLAFIFLMASANASEHNILIDVTGKEDAFIVKVDMDTPVQLQTAWSVLTDFDNMPAFVRNLTTSKIVRRDANQLLVRQTGVAKFGFFSFKFESEREIQLEPMRRILSKSLSGTAKRMESEAVLSASDHGVKIKYSAEIVPDSALARTFGKSFVRHELEEQFTSMLSEMKRRELL